MKMELMEILCCPDCKAELKLDVKNKETALSAKGEQVEEILEGTLTCTKCETVYSIEQGIPNLLPPGLS